ncbi:Uncharacterised protein [Flavonifractor plautii]|uniref:Uncharacterized protein n=1 Tax=Flavonifractor plautii TaxID=292800 RepID=A0A174T2T7_FLAPL|nr:Uncharacterised protein [Flavonifractor plautii]
MTFSKSSPLATIWVPTSTGIRSFSNRESSFSWLWVAETVSVSIRRISRPGKAAWSSSSTFWVP